MRAAEADYVGFCDSAAHGVIDVDAPSFPGQFTSKRAQARASRSAQTVDYAGGLIRITVGDLAGFDAMPFLEGKAGVGSGFTSAEF